LKFWSDQLGNGQEPLEESLGEVLVGEKRSPPPHEITISLSKRSQKTPECRLGERAEAMARSMAQGDQNFYLSDINFGLNLMFIKE